MEEEYELERRVSRGGGDRRSEEAIENQSGKNYHIDPEKTSEKLSLIHIYEPTRLLSISYAVFCLKKKKTYYQTI
mgnify:CR=1 FL=1